MTASPPLRYANRALGRPIIQMVLNEVVPDARVRRVGRSLRDAGHEVVYVGATKQYKRGGGFLLSAEALDGLDRYLINDPLARPYDRLLEQLNALNPLARSDRRVGDTFREALGGGGHSIGTRAATLALAAPYAAAWAVHKPGLLGRSAGLLQAGVKPLRAARAVLGLHPKVIHAHDLMTFRLIAPSALAAGVPLIYDSHELESGRNAPLWSARQKRWHAFTERVSIGYAKRVITVAPAIADELAATYQIRRPAVVANAQPRANIRPNTPLRIRMGLPEDHRVILYLGGLQLGRGIRRLVDLVVGLGERVHAVLMGSVQPSFEAELQAILEAAGAARARIHLRPPVPYDDVIHEAWGADLGFNALELRCRSYELALPNKFFEYAFARVPIVSTPQQDVAALTEAYELGDVVAEDDAEALLAVARRRLLQRCEPPPEDRRQAFIQRYCWEAQEETLLGVYDELFRSR